MIDISIPLQIKLNQVKEGDILYFRKNLIKGIRYGNILYIDEMCTDKFTVKESIRNKYGCVTCFFCKEHVYLISVEMIDLEKTFNCFNILNKIKKYIRLNINF